MLSWNGETIKLTQYTRLTRLRSQIQIKNPLTFKIQRAHIHLELLYFQTSVCSARVFPYSVWNMYHSPECG